MADMQQALALGWTRPGGRHPRRWHRYLHGSELHLGDRLRGALCGGAAGLRGLSRRLRLSGWRAIRRSMPSCSPATNTGDAVVTTLLYVGIGVNFTMFLSLLLSGFFMRRRWWIKALLVLSMLPWALPAQVAFISFHWMLIYPGFHRRAVVEPVRCRRPGLVQQLLVGARIQHRRLQLEDDAVLDRDPARRPDGDPAGSVRRRRHRRRHRLSAASSISWCRCWRTSISSARCCATIWMIGDFNTPEIVSERRAAEARPTCSRRSASTTCWKTASRRSASRRVISALPLLIPVAVLLMRRCGASEVQL